VKRGLNSLARKPEYQVLTGTALPSVFPLAFALQVKAGLAAACEARLEQPCAQA
jgi:hypothetical protein